MLSVSALIKKTIFVVVIAVCAGLLTAHTLRMGAKPPYASLTDLEWYLVFLVALIVATVVVVRFAYGATVKDEVSRAVEFDVATPDGWSYERSAFPEPQKMGYPLLEKDKRLVVSRDQKPLVLKTKD